MLVAFLDSLRILIIASAIKRLKGKRSPIEIQKSEKDNSGIKRVKRLARGIIYLQKLNKCKDQRNNSPILLKALK